MKVLFEFELNEKGYMYSSQYNKYEKYNFLLIWPKSNTLSMAICCNSDKTLYIALV